MTRFTNYLANEKKVYIAEMKFGFSTDTGDLDGKIIERINKIPSKSDFKKILKEFLGKTVQEAPKFSSLKHKGKPLYYYARLNKKVPKNKTRRYFKTRIAISIRYLQIFSRMWKRNLY